jgi:hypothetical protein
MTKRLPIVLIALAICLTFLLVFRVYVVRGSVNVGTLFWNSNEGLLFIGEGSDGASVSYARYLLDPLVAALGHVKQPENKRCSRVFVIRIISNDVQRYDTDLAQQIEEPFCGFHVYVFQDQFYAVSWPRLWKWSETRFEPATLEESKAFHEAGITTQCNSQSPSEFDNANSWSKRTFGQGAPEYKLSLNGLPVSVIFHGETWPPAPSSVELIRSGQNRQQIWTPDGRPHRVSRVEYERICGSR